MRSSREKEIKEKVDVDRVLNDIRSLRNRLSEMTPIVTTPPPMDDHQGSKLTISRLGPSSRSGHRSPPKERVKDRLEREREAREKLSSPQVLKNKSLELKKSFLLDSETSEAEMDGYGGHDDSLSDIPSNADQDRAFSDSDEDPALSMNGKSHNKSHAPALDLSSRRKEDVLARQLEESRRELKKRNQIEKEFQEVGEGLRKLAVEREGEIEQLQSENQHLKSQMKSMESDLKRSKISLKGVEKDLDEARKAEAELKTQTVELEAKLQFEAQRNTKLLARVRANEITADMEGVYPSQFSQSGPLPIDGDDERDVVISKLKGLVNELQTQLTNSTHREKDRSGDVAEELRRAKDEVERVRAECAMHKDITARMQREINSLEHELAEVRGRERKLRAELDHSSRTLKEREKRVRESGEDGRKRDGEVRKMSEEAEVREAELQDTWREMRRLEEENRRLTTQNNVFAHDLEDMRTEVARQSRERKELALTVQQREDELGNNRAALLEAESELSHMSNQMEALTTEIVGLQRSASEAEANRKLAENSDALRERVGKLEEELRLATVHFQDALVKAEKDYMLKAENERMNHLDALFALNQEKERAENSVRDLEALLRDRNDELSRTRHDSHTAVMELEEKAKRLRHYVDMEAQIEKQVADLSNELNLCTEREKKMADENNTLRDEISALQAKVTELMEMISSREKREASMHDKLKQAEDEAAARTKDLRRLARALKMESDKNAKLQEEVQMRLQEKDDSMADMSSELERSRTELSECARTLVALEEELLRLRRESEQAQSRPDLEHELRVKSEEVSLLEREVLRLQGVVGRQQREISEMDRVTKAADAKVGMHRELSTRRSEDVSNLQMNVSTLTTKLKAQLDNLMRLQSLPPSSSPTPLTPSHPAPPSTSHHVNLDASYHSPPVPTRSGYR